MKMATGASVENFISGCPCSLAQLSTSHSRSSVKLRSAQLHKRSSAFTALSRKCSHLPSYPRSSLEDVPQLNSEDRIGKSADRKPELSLEEKSGSYVPRNNQNDDSNKKVNAAQSALERAAAYKKLKESGSSSVLSSKQGQSTSSAPSLPPTKDSPEVEILRGQAFRSRFQTSNSEASSSTSDSLTASDTLPYEKEDTSDIVTRSNVVDTKSSIEEKRASSESNYKDGEGSSGSGKRKLEAKSIAAFERAEAYKQQQAEMIDALRGTSDGSSNNSKETNAATPDDKVVEIEIITRDGVIKRKLMNADEQIKAFANMKEVKRKGVSGIDFAGLGFADKKKSGRPAGLNEVFVAPPTGMLPEVEVLTRDGESSQTANDEQRQESELYKPRVSTWGVFPRPADISKTYGGGRIIRPGENLETEEERKARDARTKQLLDDYRKKFGLDVSPKIKAEADQVLKQGNGMMDSGRVTEALAMFELAMKKMPAGSELHGVAALQSAVCLDSLSRYDEARQVYEKLLSHPNGRVSKQARRFLFGFKAMESLKVKGEYKWDPSVYREYFDSFADGYNTPYKASEEENASENLLPYALLLAFPIVLVFALAASKT